MGIMNTWIFKLFPAMITLYMVIITITSHHENRNPWKIMRKPEK